MRERDACGLFQRTKTFDRDAAVGRAGGREDGFGYVLGPLELRPAVGDAAADATVVGAEMLDLLDRLPRRALDLASPRFAERSHRRDLLAHRPVVALDHDELGHGLAGDWLALAALPVRDLAQRLRD